MHELSVIHPIVKIACRIAKDNDIEQVTAVRLAVGELHDVQDDWAQKYYIRFSKGTVLEGSELIIRRIPIVFKCPECGNETSFTHFEFAGADTACPKCGYVRTEMISGREMQLEGLEYPSR